MIPEHRVIAYRVGNQRSTVDRGLSEQKPKSNHTIGGIPRWSPTLVLVARFSAYVWQSGRDAQFSLTYGRLCLTSHLRRLQPFVKMTTYGAVVRSQNAYADKYNHVINPFLLYEQRMYLNHQAIYGS